MFALIESLTEGFSPTFEDDGTSLAPAVRSTATSASVHKCRFALARVQQAVDTLLTSWARGDRGAGLALTDRVQLGLLELANWSRAIYWTAVEMTYSDQAFRNGYDSFDRPTPELEIVQRANKALGDRIIAGGCTRISIDLLTSEPSDTLFAASGFHTIGQRVTTNDLRVDQGALTEARLIEIHDEACAADAVCAERLSHLREIWDVSVPIGQYMSISSRIWEHQQKANPLPPGVEPSGGFRVSF